MTTAAHSPLIEVNACPACGAAGGQVADLPFSNNKYAELLRELQAPIEAVRLIRCGSCESLYRNPWLTPEAMAPIYQDRYATHPDGISKFATPDYVFGQSYIDGGASRFNAFLHQQVTPFRRYGEIGCPVWGMLPYYEAPRYRMWFGLAEVPADAYVAGILAGHIGRSRHGVVRALRALSGFSQVPAPQELFWLTHHSPTFWGKRCTYNGTECVNLVRGRTLRRVDAAEPIPGGPLDVLSMIDFLDHHADPVAVLAPFAAQARYLFIWTHGNNERTWSVQHVINYSGKGLAALARRSGFELVARHPGQGETHDYGVLLRSVQL